MPRPALRSACLALALLSGPLSAFAQTEGTRVVGRVTGPDGRDPIAGVTVKLQNRTVATDARGWFAFPQAEPRRYPVAFEMIGYAPRTDSVTIVDGQITDVQVRLSQQAIELPPVAVTVRSRWLNMNGYYERRQGGLAGKYVTHEDIEKRAPARFPDIFHGMPGVRVIRTPDSRFLVRFNHSATDKLGVLDPRRRLPGCEPDLYIDGNKHRDPWIPTDETYVKEWNFLSPLIIEAIEVYTGAATPMNYSHPCGVVLVWTRRK